MEIISTAEFNKICNEINTIIIKFGEVDQPKVYMKNGCTILKLFYPKKNWVTSDRIRPRALRFCRNSKNLRELGYQVPDVTKIQYCADSKIYLVYYPKIEGTDVRKAAALNPSILHDVAHFTADLHRKGIFFRSIHLENILYTKENKLALIDLTDVRFKSSSLSIYHRYRNLKHLFQTPRDQNILNAFGKEKFLKIYFKASQLSAFAEKLLGRLIRKT